jgi:hypothetical protein
MKKVYPERLEEISNGLGDEARRVLSGTPGDPLAVAEWKDLVFVIFRVQREALDGLLPRGVEVETYEGEAILSLAAVTMRHFRRHATGSRAGHLFARVKEQRFLNLRTSVRSNDVKGVHFLWGWANRPLGLPLPDSPFGLTCSFARINFDCDRDLGVVSGSVERERGGTFGYRGRIAVEPQYRPFREGTLGYFALERYNGIFNHRGTGRIFRAWHPQWLSTRVLMDHLDTELVGRAFPWFNEARRAEAFFCPGFREVWIGRPHRLTESGTEK